LIYDISRPIDPSTPVWPGDVHPELEWTMLRDRGEIVNLSTLRLSAHTGTHIDAPYHISNEGAPVGALPLEAYLGAAVVVDASSRPRIDSALIGPILRFRPLPERILFRTGAWGVGDPFPSEFPAFDPGCVSLLAAAGVLLVGTDAPSVDPFDSIDLPAHHALFAAGIAVLESLALDSVPPGNFELIALPLKLTHADGSPVRAILRSR